VAVKIEDATVDNTPTRQVERWPQPRLKNYRKPLRLGGEQFVIWDVPDIQSSRAAVYWALDQTLISGEFSMLRCCRSCGTYFVTQRIDKQSCSRDCNTHYQNKSRGPAYMKKWRQKRTKKAGAVADKQRFAEFLNRTKGNVPAGSDMALFIKRKIPGGWQAVKSWHTNNQPAYVVWSNLPSRMKTVLREFWESQELASKKTTPSVA
jgi:hypothetical protein